MKKILSLPKITTQTTPQNYVKQQKKTKTGYHIKKLLRNAAFFFPNTQNTKFIKNRKNATLTTIQLPKKQLLLTLFFALFLLQPQTLYPPKPILVPTASKLFLLIQKKHTTKNTPN